MRFAVVSSSGQVLARGALCVLEDADGDLILAFRTDRGKVIEGGKIDANGDLEEAGQKLFRSFFQVWGMTGLTLTSQN